MDVNLKNSKIKVGIVGGTGYTGVELLRILSKHPRVQLHCITSRSEHGTKVSDMFSSLRGIVDLEFSDPDDGVLEQCDLVFFATPNGVAMRSTKILLQKGVKVIDLSADYRIKDVNVWQHWYKMKHESPELLAEAVYGLPEINREKIKSASLVANPGCYPTSVQLALIPLLEKSLIDPNSIIADCKSGVSGAGRKAALGTSLCEASENFSAYAVSGHRHQPEIEQGLEAVSKSPVSMIFVPHLTPMIRGIHATVYAKLKDVDDFQSLYVSRYVNEPFVDVMSAGSHPETRSVKGSNVCRISPFQLQGKDTIIVLSVIDNLVKGASGQAVQNMNIMFEFAETDGLEQLALLP